MNPRLWYESRSVVPSGTAFGTGAQGAQGPAPLTRLPRLAFRRRGLAKMQDSFRGAMLPRTSAGTNADQKASRRVRVIEQADSSVTIWSSHYLIRARSSK